MDDRDELEKHGFSGGWIAQADLPPLTDADAVAHATHALPRFEEKVTNMEHDFGPRHPMTLHYRQILDVQRRLADGR